MGHIISQDDIPKCQMLQITAVVSTELSREKNEMMRVANVMECGFHLFS